MTQTTAPTPPPGFTLADTHSPFFAMVGPFWMRHDDDGQLELALVADARHLNNRGQVHGGMLAAFVDLALVRTVSRSQDPPARLATTSLTVEYAGAVNEGETVIAKVDILRIGRRLAFASCHLHCGDRRVVQASAVLANVE